MKLAHSVPRFQFKVDISRVDKNVVSQARWLERKSWCSMRLRLGLFNFSVASFPSCKLGIRSNNLLHKFVRVSALVSHALPLTPRALQTLPDRGTETAVSDRMMT